MRAGTSRIFYAQLLRYYKFNIFHNNNKRYVRRVILHMNSKHWILISVPFVRIVSDKITFVVKQRIYCKVNKYVFIAKRIYPLMQWTDGVISWGLFNFTVKFSFRKYAWNFFLFKAKYRLFLSICFVFKIYFGTQRECIFLTVNILYP